MNASKVTIQQEVALGGTDRLFLIFRDGRFFVTFHQWTGGAVRQVTDEMELTYQQLMDLGDPDKGTRELKLSELTLASQELTFYIARPMMRTIKIPRIAFWSNVRFLISEAQRH